MGLFLPFYVGSFLLQLILPLTISLLTITTLFFARRNWSVLKWANTYKYIMNWAQNRKRHSYSLVFCHQNGAKQELYLLKELCSNYSNPNLPPPDNVPRCAKADLIYIVCHSNEYDRWLMNRRLNFNCFLNGNNLIKKNSPTRLCHVKYSIYLPSIKKGFEIIKHNVDG